MGTIIVDDLIEELSKKYNLRSKIYHSTNTIEVVSSYDDWLMEVSFKDNGDVKVVRLMHKNSVSNRFRCSYHEQGKFETIEAAYRYVYGHTRKPLFGDHRIKKVFFIKKLLKKIADEQKSRYRKQVGGGN